METSEISISKKQDIGSNFQPRIVAFLCNWCAYSGADLAGVSRLKTSPNLRINN